MSKLEPNIVSHFQSSNLTRSLFFKESMKSISMSKNYLVEKNFKIRRNDKITINGKSAPQRQLTQYNG